MRHSLRPLLVLPALFVFAPSADAVFMDVAVSHPYSDAIEYVQEEGIVEGYIGGEYHPGSWINRAEFAKIIVAAMATKEEIESCRYSPFLDVELDNWFTPYICEASRRNLITGYPDGSFRIGDNISFVEAAAVLQRAYGNPSRTEPWYRGPVEHLATEGAIPFSVKRFDQLISRGEMAQMIYALETEEGSRVGPSYASLEESMRTEALSSYPYDWERRVALLKPGQKVGWMTYVGTTEAKVEFAGDVTISGRYVDDSDVDGLSFGGVCLVLDEDSRYRVAGGVNLCLKDHPSLSAVPAGSKGRITVRISRIWRNHCECEGWDTAQVIELSALKVDPETELACLQEGGEWQADAVRRRNWENAESEVERGVCYPSDNPYVGRMPEFDGCGPLTANKLEPWYGRMERSALEEGLDLSQVTMVCRSDEGGILAMLLAMPDGEPSQVWRFLVSEGTVEKARVTNSGPAFKMMQFGARAGHVIEMRHEEDFPDLCRAVSYAEYDYVNNVVSDYGGGCVEMYR